ncbi:NAD(P)-binding protein [Violaceomyces palustris]|uniref:NAD(P)-binding protein n=1 Tax=Violaceomyces palustris TaxID=1673888 RepID=A0ACD0P808_9BASI|nr:NAD(P)-binding protein [Violaceomyces palustris]
MVSKALSEFFSSSRYAVVGASNDPSKFGNKVLKWYSSRSLQVTPINPKDDSIEGIKTVNSVENLEEPTQTSISIVTPPKITLQVVKKSILELGVPFVWLQPGAEDKDLVEWLDSQDEQTRSKVIYGGPCILVSGDQLAREKGRL